MIVLEPSREHIQQAIRLSDNVIYASYGKRNWYSAGSNADRQREAWRHCWARWWPTVGRQRAAGNGRRHRATLSSRRRTCSRRRVDRPAAASRRPFGTGPCNDLVLQTKRFDSVSTPEFCFSIRRTKISVSRPNGWSWRQYWSQGFGFASNLGLENFGAGLEGTVTVLDREVVGGAVARWRPADQHAAVSSTDRRHVGRRPRRSVRRRTAARAAVTERRRRAGMRLRTLVDRDRRVCDRPTAWRDDRVRRHRFRRRHGCIASQRNCCCNGRIAACRLHVRHCEYIDRLVCSSISSSAVPFPVGGSGPPS